MTDENSMFHVISTFPAITSKNPRFTARDANKRDPWTESCESIVL